MKRLRICVTVLFFVTLCLFLFFYVQQLDTDRTVPVITIPAGTLKVSLEADRDELMQGISAHDEKDGDLTDAIIIESISRFTEPGTAVVTYAVCDSDNHVASASRKIHYTDYTPPKFTLSGPLVFSTLENPQVLKILGAVDVIDGDISGKVIISATDYISNTAGTFTISAKVSNSRGDIIYIQLPIYIEEQSLSAPQLTLRDYLLYLPTGSSYDTGANLLSAAASDGEDLRGQVRIDTNLDLHTPGTYQVHYYATDAQGRRSHTVLTIVVED